MAASTTTSLTIDHSVAKGGSWVGFLAESNGANSVTRLDVTDSVVSGNPGYGISVGVAGGSTSEGTVANSLIAGNSGGSGLRAVGPGAKLVVSGNTVTYNGTGLYLGSGGVIESAGNNTVRNNTTNANGTLTTFSNM
jgi:hypothetical protein